MHDERVIRRAALCRINAAGGLGGEGVCREPVYRFGGDAHEPAPPEDAGGFFQLRFGTAEQLGFWQEKRFLSGLLAGAVREAQLFGAVGGDERIDDLIEVAV